MDRRAAIGVLVVSNVMLLMIWFFGGGGIAGIASDPFVQLSVLGIIVLISIPVSWLSYRRMMRNPIVVAAGEPMPATLAQVRLDHAPVTLIAERWKVVAWTVYVLAAAAIVVAIGWLQPGVCRMISVAGAVALFFWPLASFTVCVFTLPTLTLSRDGLSMATAWQVRSWSWDEIRDIRITKGTVPFVGRFLRKRPSQGIYFRRFRPADRLTGPAQAGFRAIWNLSGDELGAVLNSARERWSTSLGKSYIPVPKTWRTYVAVTLRLAAIAGILWLWYSQPCQHP